MLGVYSGPSAFPPRTNADSENPDLPATLSGLSDPLDAGEIFADFEVCPLEPERKGEMQAVCIELAKNIFVHKFR
jgi:hypothetical protein